MRKRSFNYALLVIAAASCAGLLAQAQNQVAVPGKAKKSAAKAAAAKPAAPPEKPDRAAGKAAASAEQKPGDTADAEAIRASADAFTRLYNEHDAKGLAALFIAKAEVVDENGNHVKGREAIEAEFAQQFAEQPECTMQVEIDAVRVLAPSIALEEGIARCVAAPGEGEQITRYTCVHVKLDGQWRLASVTDTAAGAEDLTPHDQLQEMTWLIGDWIDESADSSVQTTCDWDESGNFLISRFEVHLAGRVSMSGTTRIGWDAVKKQFRSWVFDSVGGFSEGTWIRRGNEWIVTTTGATPAGEICSSTNVYRLVDGDTITFRSFDRIINGELTDDIDEVIVKRRAPAPVE